MKKVVIAFIAGALLMASGQAIADDLSLVGRKVGSEAKVIMNGVEISDAVIIDSKSYAPVRDITESFGATVNYEAGVITIETADAKEAIKSKLQTLYNEKQYVEKKIGDTQQIIESQLSEEGPIYKYQKLLETPAKNESIQKSREDFLAFYLAGHEEQKQALAKYETRLTEIIAEISELEAQL